MANPATPIERREVPLLEATTHRCSKHGHREFLLRWDDRKTALADVRRLAETLEDAVGRGERFEPGDVVHVGWIPLRVIAGPARTLTLVEPDFSGPRLRYVPSVDAAIAHLRAQDELTERVGLHEFLQRPSLNDRVRVCAHLAETGVVLDRSDDGWLVTCESSDEDHELATITLYELVCRFPHLVDFLALPVGCTVACTNGGDAIVWKEGREVGVRSGVSIAARLSRITAPLARCGAIR